MGRCGEWAERAREAGGREGEGDAGTHTEWEDERRRTDVRNTD
jgi:hypothetical protein